MQASNTLCACTSIMSSAILGTATTDSCVLTLTVLSGERALICDFVNLLCEASPDGVTCVTTICRAVLMRAALKRVVCNALILITFVLAAQALAESVVVNLEEPREASLYTGISNLRGWAVAKSGIAAIEIDIDGVYAFNVPMGGRVATWQTPILTSLLMRLAFPWRSTIRTCGWQPRRNG